ncbi:TPA: twin-arginine translocation signal domain-containing protein [Proteus mirabilis]
MTLLSTPLSRRRFVKVGAAGGLVATAGGLSLPFSQAMASEQTAPTSTNKEKVVWSACTVNCGSRCPLRMHVVDGEINMQISYCQIARHQSKWISVWMLLRGIWLT